MTVSFLCMESSKKEFERANEDALTCPISHGLPASPSACAIKFCRPEAVACLVGITTASMISTTRDQLRHTSSSPISVRTCKAGGGNRSGVGRSGKSRRTHESGVDVELRHDEREEDEGRAGEQPNAAHHRVHVRDPRPKPAGGLRADEHAADAGHNGDAAEDKRYSGRGTADGCCALFGFALIPPSFWFAFYLRES